MVERVNGTGARGGRSPAGRGAVNRIKTLNNEASAVLTLLDASPRSGMPTPKQRALNAKRPIRKPKKAGVKYNMEGRIDYLGDLKLDNF